MSILTDHTTEADAPTGGFDMFASREYVAPRANLLPPEMGERVALRRLTAAMIAAVVACGGIVGAVYVSTESGRGPARTALADAQAQQQSLAKQQALLAPSQEAHAKVLAAKKALQVATGSEVLWSNQLNNLRAHLTAGVRLSSLVVTEDASLVGGTAAAGSAAGVTLPSAPANSAGATSTTTTTTTASGSTIATVTLAGTAVSTFAVADWLDDLAALDGWSGVYLTSVNNDSVSGLVTYAITANITSDALSHRYANGG